MEITYCITKFNFFSSFKGGQIAHACGILNGLKKNNIDCKFLGPKNEYYANDFFNNNVNHLTFKLNIYYQIFTLIKKNKKILIRKNIENILILYFFSFLLPLRYRKNVIFEINGFTFERYLEKFPINKIYPFVLIIHKVILRRFKYIYVVSSKLKEDLLSGFLKLSPENIKYIPNGVDLQPFKRQFKVNDTKFIFLFFGIYQDYNDYTLIISAFNALRKKNGSKVQLHFIGFGKNKNLIESFSNPDQGIYSHSPKRIHEIKSMKFINDFCVGLIPLSKNKSVKYLSPIKLFDYINMGMPVIVSDIYTDDKDLPHVSEFIFKYKTGNCISLFNSMCSIIENSLPFFKRIYNNKSKFCNENSWQKRMEILLKNYINN